MNAAVGEGVNRLARVRRAAFSRHELHQRGRADSFFTIVWQLPNNLYGSLR